jgi:hypothetical protein
MTFVKSKKVTPQYPKESEMEAAVTPAVRKLYCRHNDRYQKRIHSTRSKCLISDCKFGWKRKQLVQKFWHSRNKLRF